MRVRHQNLPRAVVRHKVSQSWNQTLSLSLSQSRSRSQHQAPNHSHSLNLDQTLFLSHTLTQGPNPKV